MQLISKQYEQKLRHVEFQVKQLASIGSMHHPSLGTHSLAAKVQRSPLWTLAPYQSMGSFTMVLTTGPLSHQ